MKTQLMRRIFEFSQFPKRCSRYSSIHIVLQIVVNRIICHWAFHNIVSMWFPSSAVYNKIKPLFRHFREIFIQQFIIWCILIIVQISLISLLPWYKIISSPPTQPENLFWYHYNALVSKKQHFFILCHIKFYRSMYWLWYQLYYWKNNNSRRIKKCVSCKIRSQPLLFYCRCFLCTHALRKKVIIE